MASLLFFQKNQKFQFTASSLMFPRQFPPRFTVALKRCRLNAEQRRGIDTEAGRAFTSSILWWKISVPTALGRKRSKTFTANRVCLRQRTDKHLRFSSPVAVVKDFPASWMAVARLTAKGSPLSLRSSENNHCTTGRYFRRGKKFFAGLSNSLDDAAKDAEHGGRGFLWQGTVWPREKQI